MNENGKEQNFVTVQIAKDALSTAEDMRHAVHVVVDRPKIAPEPAKLQSFCFSKPLTLVGRQIAFNDLLEVLWKRTNLSKSLPLWHYDVETVKQNEKISPLRTTDSHKFEIDPNAGMVKGIPHSWSFKWNEVQCSVMNCATMFFIRVHDIEFPERGEVVITEILQAVLDIYLERERKQNERGELQVFVSHTHCGSNSWRKLKPRRKRNLATIYLKNSIKERCILQLQQFFQSKQLYERYGVPWKKVHLFCGPPGTGKTSFVFALASHFKMHISKLTITGNMTASDLETLLLNVAEKTVVLLEDVDALFLSRNEKNSTTHQIDFSTFINCLDGVGTMDGAVFFLTTNHVENLDPALLRPGRIDWLIEFDTPDREQLAKAIAVLGERWPSEHEQFLDIIAPLKPTIAALQQYLFDCIALERESILSDLDEMKALSPGRVAMAAAMMTEEIEDE